MVDMHYADPSKVLLLARALNVCPPTVYIVGCQPEFVDEAEEGLRPPVENAIPHAITEVLALLNQLNAN
jgi:Ni,Fe-hydrogenase maturation factor